MSQGLFDRDVERRLRLLEGGLVAIPQSVQSVLLAGTPAAVTTSATTETASINTAVVPNQGVAGQLQITVSLAATATVAADTFAYRIKVAGVEQFLGRLAVASIQNITTPINATVPVAMAAGASVAVSVTLQRVTGTGTLAVVASTNGNALTVLFVPD